MTIQTFNPVEFFETEQEIADYLTDASLDDDPKVFITALGHVVKHRGFAEVAANSGLNRESLYKALSGKVNPRWDTVHRILKTLDVDLKIAV